MTRQMRNRSPSSAPGIPPPSRCRLHLQDPRSRRTAVPPPRVTVPELHVVVLTATAASRRGRVIRVGTRHFFPAGGGADNSGGSEFAAGTRAATVVGELAGDFGREVAEEVGHGDEAGADDAGGDFGDAVSRLNALVSL